VKATFQHDLGKQDPTAPYQAQGGKK
jgi:hypothetical protein